MDPKLHACKVISPIRSIRLHFIYLVIHDSNHFESAGTEHPSGIEDATVQQLMPTNPKV